jgi:hypothetical protein
MKISGIICDTFSFCSLAMLSIGNGWRLFKRFDISGVGLKDFVPSVQATRMRLEGSAISPDVVLP